jgi:acyl-CoA thioester hydrolase
LDIKYKKPARLGDTIEVITEVTETTNATISLKHWALKEETILVESYVKLACIDKDGKPKRLPAELKKIGP